MKKDKYEELRNDTEQTMEKLDFYHSPSRILKVIARSAMRSLEDAYKAYNKSDSYMYRYHCDVYHTQLCNLAVYLPFSHDEEILEQLRNLPYKHGKLLTESAIYDRTNLFCKLIGMSLYDPIKDLKND